MIVDDRKERLEVFAARLKWPLLTRSLRVCVCCGDPVSWSSPVLMASPRPHTPGVVLVERLQRSQQRDGEQEVSRGRMDPGGGGGREGGVLDALGSQLASPAPSSSSTVEDKLAGKPQTNMQAAG